MIIILSLCLSFWRQRPYLPIAQLQICQHLWFSHPHQSYLFPLRLLHTGHIDLSLSQCLYHLPALPDSESIFHANCEAPSILQAIQLVTFKITALCLRTVSCCSWSGVSHLVFHVAMWKRPRGKVHVCKNTGCRSGFWWCRGSAWVMAVPSQPGCRDETSEPATTAKFYTRCPFWHIPPHLLTSLPIYSVLRLA